LPCGVCRSGAGRAMRRRQRSVAVLETAIGLGALRLAALMFWQAWSIPVSPLYARIGPSIFPYFTAAAFAVLAVLMIIDGLRGGWQTEEEKAVATEWRAILYVLAGLAANVALIDYLGFTAASTVLFVLVARGFGSRTPLRDAAIGFAIALAAYFGFA